VATYSGNLVRTASNVQHNANFYPDNAHAQTQTPDEYPASHRVPQGTGAAFDGSSFPDDVVVGGGSHLGSPSRSHDSAYGGVRLVYGQSANAWQDNLNVQHGEDGQHRYEQTTYTPPPLQGAHEVYSDGRYESHVQPNTQNNAGNVYALHGINGNPQNNPTNLMYPQGVRPGVERHGPWFESERRLGRRKYRYDAQPRMLRETYVPANGNAINAPSTSPTVVDTWKTPGMFTRVKTPALFRQPPSVDESYLSADTGANNDVISGGMAG
jgi:hypothetical protein